MAPPGSDDWFEDYDTDMSDGSGDEGPASLSDSGGAGRGHDSSSDDDGGGFEGPASEVRSDRKRSLYTVIDRANLRRMQVGAAGRGWGRWVLPLRLRLLATRFILHEHPPSPSTHRVPPSGACRAPLPFHPSTHHYLLC